MTWLQSIRRSLDLAPLQVEVFFRDDDAGWDDSRLTSLLDLFAAHRTPLDVAVIPAEITGTMAVELRRRYLRMPARLGLHQHGWRHENHERVGRKYEFGPSRGPAMQLVDILAGNRRLEEKFDTQLDPIFTPPWNRCSQETVDQLNGLGFHALSRDRSATQLKLGPLHELAVGIDWAGLWRPPSDASAIAQKFGDLVNHGDAIGIMLHHATMDDVQRAALGELLALLATHSNVSCHLMRDLIARGDEQQLVHVGAGA